MGKFNSGGTVQVAKTAPATTYENEDVKTAGDNTRRRIAAANSRSKANLYWTSLLNSGAQKPSGGGSKTTLG